VLRTTPVIRRRAIPSRNGLGGSPGSADVGVTATDRGAWACGLEVTWTGSPRSAERLSFLWAFGVLVSPAPAVDCVDWVTPPVGLTGAAGAGAGFCGAGAEPPPVGTLSTYSFGAEVGSVVSGGGAVSVVVCVGVVSVGVVWVVVVVCA
jgi:hypothetical protein